MMKFKQSRLALAAVAVLAGEALSRSAATFKDFAYGVALKGHNKLFAYMAGQGYVMALNDFAKEEVVLFETALEGFEDELVMSKAATIFRSDQTMMARTGDIVWRPQPSIATSYDGTDQTANFKAQTRLYVPATIGYEKSSPWVMDAKELRDAIQEGSLYTAARQKLASDINVAAMSVATVYGSLVVKRTVAATGFDDVALCDAVMNEQGVPGLDRYMALSSRDYNNMASGLAGRGTMTGKPTTAYEKAYVGNIASFETYKLDYANRLAAAGGGGGITMNTLDAGANYYTPVAKRTGTAGESSNVDNRFQTITVSSTTSVAAGDCFTVAGLNAVHHITKQDTGQLKTFRVVSVDSSTTMTICPPMVTAQGATQAEAQYKNCVINTKAANSALVFLNTVAAAINPFWRRQAIELLPGRYEVPSDAGTKVMRASTESGFELVMQKFYDINTMITKFRLDLRFGAVNKDPEQSGIVLFSQT